MNKKMITSAQNPVIKLVKELQSKKSARKKKGLFIVEGLRGVKEIPSHITIEHLIVSEAQEEHVPSHLQIKEMLVVPNEIFEKISETQSPQGMMAITQMPHLALEDLKLVEGPYLILENLQDPGNLGTIIRTAHAFDFKGILLTKGSVDAFSPKVVRATMSSLFYMPLVVDYSIEEYIAYFKAAQVPLYTTALNEEAKAIGDIAFPKQLGLIIGNEGNGVTKVCIEAAKETMIIPMPGGAESLNASVATAICMYEITC